MKRVVFSLMLTLGSFLTHAQIWQPTTGAPTDMIYRQGDIEIRGDNKKIKFMETAGVRYLHIYHGGATGAHIMSSTPSGSYPLTYYSQDHIFKTWSNSAWQERLRITEAGSIITNGYTSLRNPTGRNLILDTDNGDSWLTWHDENDFWFSMGIDRSDGGKLKLNYGGEVGTSDQFVLTSAGNLGLGTASVTRGKLSIRNAQTGIYSISATSDTEGRGFEVLSNDFVFGTAGSALEINLGTGNGNTYSSLSAYKAGKTSFSDLILQPGGGNIGIGTLSPDPYYKLSVNGSIRAKEIKVNTGWSDFVFFEDYKLRPLSEVEIFIQENKHLPDVPSAAVVEKEGVNLGEMDAILLRKIEELTLYTIQTNKKMDDLKEVNREMKLEDQRLKKENEYLKNELQKLKTKR